MFDQLLDFTVTYSAPIFAIGILSFLVSIISLPYIVGHIPEDYFSHHRRHLKPDGASELAIRILKNLLGAVLLVAGFIMLFTPGQGLLTILFGLMLMNYPGKYRLECWLIGKPAVFRALNYLRSKNDHPPLLPPPDVQ